MILVWLDPMHIVQLDHDRIAFTVWLASPDSTTSTQKMFTRPGTQRAHVILFFVLFVAGWVWILNLLRALIDWLIDWYVIAKAVEWTEPGTCVGSFLSTILMMQNGKAWVIYELLQSVWQDILYRYIQVLVSCQSIQFNICVIDALHMCCIPFECSPCDCLTSSDHQSMFGSSHCPHPERLFGLPGPVFWPWQHAKWSWWPGATLLSMRPLTVNVSIHCCCVL